MVVVTPVIIGPSFSSSMDWSILEICQWILHLCVWVMTWYQITRLMIKSVLLILLFFLSSLHHLTWHLIEGEVGGRKVSMTCSVLLPKITFLHCMRSMSSVHVQQWINPHHVECFWLVNTCIAVPLHKLSHNKPSQNYYYGMQTPSKPTQTIT